LADFITNNETDFINFKTKLLLGTAGDDPVERARLITDIVRSIAKIPDNIVRSVYVRETAHQLDVEERVLYTEIAKVRLKNEEQPSKHSAAAVPEISVSTPVRGATPCDLEESVLIRYMLLFGNNELYEEERNGFMRSVSVGEFIVRELAEDDLELLNPLFRAIQTEYQQQYESPSFIPARHFIAHPDIKISTVAANILSEPYELSKIWYKMENFIETEQMKLAELLPKILDNYKMRRVEMLSREIDNRILESQNNPDPRQIMDLLKRKNAINAIRRKLNEKLGRTGIH